MHHFLSRYHALAAGLGGAVLAASAAAGGLGATDAAPAPFLWRDVALVYFLAALPLAASLATATIGRLSLSRHSFAILLVESLVLFLVPRLYIQARFESDVNRAVQLGAQSRFGEARALIQRILVFAPQAKWGGNPLSLAAARIDEIMLRIEARVMAPLPADATDDERLARARDLAMLGRTTEALAILASSPRLADSPDAANLRGTIYETQYEWSTARGWYAKAKALWQPLADSQERTAGLSQAITGVAFCERKLGRLRQAETAWQELLALSPTADTHFLLAQFYEDTQQAAKARFHAQQAMQLDPRLYKLQGRRLIEKLVTSHFGCAAAFSAEFAPATPFAGP